MSEQKQVDTKLGPKTDYKPQKETKDKSIISVRIQTLHSCKYVLKCFQYMTVSKAMGVLGLMNVRAIEHPITGTQFLQERVLYYEVIIICVEKNLCSDKRLDIQIGKQKAKLYQTSTTKFC